MKLLKSIPDDYELATSIYDFVTFDQINGVSIKYGTEFIIKGRKNIEHYVLVEGMSYDNIIKSYLKNKQIYVRHEKS
jgi:hypothetical protein